MYVSSTQYKVLLYSLDGRLLSTYSAYEWSLGVKSVSWSPSSQFLAIGSYDEKVWMMLKNCASFLMIACFWFLFVFLDEVFLFTNFMQFLLKS